MAFVEISNHAKDVTGQKFGRLKALWPAKKTVAKTGAISVHWMCGCDCGKMKVVVVNDLLRNGRGTESCGCLNREHAGKMGKSWHRHGYSGLRSYGVWRAMVARCTNADHRAYKNYGKRGIRVCERWIQGEDGKSGFECFVEDMGPRLSPKHSIDRFPDNDGNYEPTNCRWATQKEQTNNTRVNRTVSAFGRTGSLASFTGGANTALYSQVYQRIVGRGWSAERALIAAGIKE